MQRVPVLEQQGLAPRPALGAASGGDQREPPWATSNVHTGCPPQAQRLHQVIAEPALQRPSHCEKRRGGYWSHQQQHGQRWLPGSPHGGPGVLGRAAVAMGCSGTLRPDHITRCGLVGSTREMRGGQWGRSQAGHGDKGTEVGRGMGTEIRRWDRDTKMRKSIWAGTQDRVQGQGVGTETG